MDSRPLLWSADKKLALFGHLLVDEKFQRGLGSHVQPEWFGSEVALVRARAVQLRFQAEHRRYPTPQELPECSFVRGSEEDQDLVSRAIAAALPKTREYPLDALEPEILEWHRGLLFRDAYDRAGPLYAKGKVDKAREAMRDWYLRDSQSTLSKDQRVDFLAFEEHFRARKDEYTRGVSFGNPVIDHLISPEATRGSLLEGKSTVIMAGTNTGKSTCVDSIIVDNILAGEDSLLLSHEDPAVDTEFKLMSGILRVPKAALLQMLDDSKGVEVLREVAKLIHERVDFIRMSPTGLTVERVVARVRELVDEKRARTGRGYRLFCDDYPQKMISERVHGDLRHVFAHVYLQLIGLADEHGFHSVLPIQLNRVGNQVARARMGSDQQGRGQKPRWIVSGDVSETFNPINDAANVLSLNRTPELEALGITVYYFEKTKDSKFRNWAVACRSNFDFALSHARDLPATYFRADWIEADTLDKWVTQFDGQAVPQHVLASAMGKR